MLGAWEASPVASEASAVASEASSVASEASAVASEASTVASRGRGSRLVMCPSDLGRGSPSPQGGVHLVLGPLSPRARGGCILRNCRPRRPGVLPCYVVIWVARVPSLSERSERFGRGRPRAGRRPSTDGGWAACLDESPCAVAARSTSCARSPQCNALRSGGPFVGTVGSEGRAGVELAERGAGRGRAGGQDNVTGAAVVHGGGASPP